MERSARTGLVILAACALMASGLAAPAAAATATLALDASSSVIVAGQSVTLSATLADDASCLGGRTVDLWWRSATEANASVLDQGTTAADGAVSFDASPTSTGRFQVTVDASGSCGAAASGELLVRVRVRVDASVLAGSLTAGSCVHVTAAVTPPKPGERVDLQRRAAGAWTTIDTLRLDAFSQATARLCVGWADIGIVRVRIRWSAQDPLNETNDSPTLAFQVTQAPWMERIDALVGGRSMSVVVADGGVDLYARAPAAPRIPASNEKLLLSMALLDTFGPTDAIPTIAAAERDPRRGVLRGDLWILGRGDPEVDRASLAALARKIRLAGVRRIAGRVLGSTSYFRRDWDAPGWNDVARDYVNRPTALTYEGNGAADPERAAAAALTERLQRLGVRVGGRPGSGSAPSGLRTIASIRSRALGAILVKMLRPSNNFIAEVLGKRLGAQASGPPGTIAKGAAAIAAWVRGQGVSSFTLFDDSGLSYANRVDAAGVVELLTGAEDRPWGDRLRAALPTGGQGTLRDRLAGVRVRAKTGTLDGVSALSGWVWSERLDRWAEFSILSRGLSKPVASGIEDRIVRTLERSAR